MSRVDAMEKKWIQSFDTLKVTDNDVRDKRGRRTILTTLRQTDCKMVIGSR